MGGSKASGNDGGPPFTLVTLSTNEHYGPNVILKRWYHRIGQLCSIISRVIEVSMWWDPNSTQAVALRPMVFWPFRNHATNRFFNVNQWFDPFTNAEHGHTTDSQSMVLVYTDVGRGAIQGDQITDLLREVPLPVEDKMGHIYYEPRNLHHVDVRQTELDVVEIVLGKPEGGLISLAEGVTTVKLHFRRLP